MESKEVCLSREEAAELYHCLEFQYIDYEKFVNVHKVLNRIRDRMGG